MHLFFLCLLTLLLSGCQPSFLNVQTDYLTYKDLASFYVKTPDPRLSACNFGQRLIISWSLPKHFLKKEHLQLEVTLRFRNREEILEIIPIGKQRNTYVYPLLNEDYLEKGGILTYKIDLKDKENILEEWRHLMWTESIEIPYSTELDFPSIYTPPDVDWGD